MMNGNYYHRTHKNHKPNMRGKVDHEDNPANLFSIQNTDREIKWVYSAEVSDKSHIGYHQVIYALANHLLIYSVNDTATLLAVRSRIRTSADLCSFAAPRGFSQLVTSFLGAMYHRHPPYALRSLIFFFLVYSSLHIQES